MCHHHRLHRCARGGLVHPASALARIPQGRVLRPGRNEQVLHRQPHHPLHQRRHAGADVHHHGSAAHRQIADYGSMGRVQDRRRRLRMDARHRNRRSDSAGGHRHHDGHGHAEIQGHAGPDRQHQPRGPREPHRPACGARLQRRGLPGSQIHQGQQGPHRDPAVHQPRHGVHDAVDEHRPERPDARRLLDRRLPHRRRRAQGQAHRVLQHGRVLQLLRAGHHELPAHEHGVRALAARRRVRAAHHGGARH